MTDKQRRRELHVAMGRALADRGWCCEVLSRAARAKGALITWFLGGAGW